MRPDTRSFSFTWLRGNQHQEELSLGRPTTRSQTVSKAAHGYENMDTETEDSTPDEDPAKDQSLKKCSTGRLKLRRFGTSFLRNITNTGDSKYNSIDEEEGNGEGDGNIEEAVESNTNIGIDQTASTSKSTLSIGKRLNKTVQEVKSTLGNIGQRLRRSSVSRRYRMKAESPSTPVSPTRRILGRTPTKLYSPFGFDSPAQKTPKRLGTQRASTPRLSKASRTQSAGKEDSNMRDIRRGLTKFQFMSRDVTRRSVRF